MNKMKEMPPVMILCGGYGTRLREVTELLPKPMVTIGEQPIVWHIMKSYAAFGVKRFILCLGYKAEAFIDYFMNYHLRIADTTIKLGKNPEVTLHDIVEDEGWEVTLAHTGVDAGTGKRIAVASRYLKNEDEDFFLTYGDGVADINIDKLYKHHKKIGKMLTLSIVRSPARFGEIQFDGDIIQNFSEKKSLSHGYINGGFMVLKKNILSEYMPDVKAEDSFEFDNLPAIVADKQAVVYKHDGFWQCMDTPREYTYLNELWKSGQVPWTKYWK